MNVTAATITIDVHDVATIPTTIGFYFRPADSIVASIALTTTTDLVVFSMHGVPLVQIRGI